MKYKDDFAPLGVITQILTNGMGRFEGGQVCGGKVGDMVVKPKGAINARAIIIDGAAWADMPKNEADAKKRGLVFGADEISSLRNEIAALKKKNAELESKLKTQDNKEDLI